MTWTSSALLTLLFAVLMSLLNASLVSLPLTSQANRTRENLCPCGVARRADGSSVSCTAQKHNTTNTSSLLMLCVPFVPPVTGCVGFTYCWFTNRELDQILRLAAGESGSLTWSVCESSLGKLKKSSKLFLYFLCTNLPFFNSFLLLFPFSFNFLNNRVFSGSLYFYSFSLYLLFLPDPFCFVCLHSSGFKIVYLCMYKWLALSFSESMNISSENTGNILSLLSILSS